MMPMTNGVTGGQTNWDRLLGTFMSQSEADKLEAKYKKIRGARRQADVARNIVPLAVPATLARLPSSSTTGSSGSDIESVTDSEGGGVVAMTTALEGVSPSSSLVQTAAAAAAAARGTNGTATPRSRASSVSMTPPAVVLRSM